MKKFLLIAGLFIPLAVPNLIRAEVFRLKDGTVYEGTVVERTDRQIKVRTKDRVETILLYKLSTGGEVNIKGNARVNIEVFIVDWCPHCRALENFLKANNFSYTRIDVEKSTNARARMKKYGNDGSYPFTVVGSYTVRGNNPDQIMEYIRMQE